jgi:non-heme chloroperoxidase
VLPLPISALKSSSPVLRNPANRNRAVPLAFEQFRYGFANAVSEEEAKQLCEDFAVPASGRSLFQAATANLNPWTEAKVTPRTPTAGRCCSSPASGTIPSRGRSSTPFTSSSRTTRA